MVDFGGHPNVLHYEKSYLVYLQKSTSPDQNSCYTVAILSKAVFVCQQASLATCLPMFASFFGRTWIGGYGDSGGVLKRCRSKGDQDRRQSLSTTCAKRIASLHACCIICILLLCIASQAKFEKFTAFHCSLVFRQVHRAFAHHSILSVAGHVGRYKKIGSSRTSASRPTTTTPRGIPWRFIWCHICDPTMRIAFIFRCFDALTVFFLSLGALWCSGRRRSGQQFETWHEFGLETLEWWIKVRNNRCHRSRQICCSICSNRRCLSVYPVWMYQI